MTLPNTDRPMRHIGCGGEVTYRPIPNGMIYACSKCGMSSVSRPPMYTTDIENVPKQGDSA